VLTTEKDAVKLCGKAKVPMEVRRRLYFQPINIVFNDYSAIDFLQNLEKDVRTDS
jgi:tetraacyldisaccharide 4'-kinase